MKSDGIADSGNPVQEANWGEEKYAIPLKKTSKERLGKSATDTETDSAPCTTKAGWTWSRGLIVVVGRLVKFAIFFFYLHKRIKIGRYDSFHYGKTRLCDR